ncbi:hypothetical protein SAMN05216487_0983 [Pseudomonas sp. UC 17F4]|uniref:hypothetical protein n=1 Tax=Pseudomonas sp. UC 17F4 TaxID=1855328 RepID=UPI00088585F0|nr:hypothetical protein [Pseudomonas sp. UC 17F4]SDQ30500.1 hypothetical protein SAMN05216487_0983 [Pseudomonas sp. UC 17F4]
MLHLHDVPGFLRRYFATFICAFLLACFSCALTAIVVVEGRFSTVREQANYTVILVMTASLVLSIGNMLVVRGRPWGVWVVVALLLVNLLALLVSYGPRSSNLLFLIITVLSLSGLYLLNSQRQREMRSRLVAIRKSRINLLKAMHAGNRQNH